jgi:D-xylose transport system substrate-binding protein
MFKKKSLRLFAAGVVMASMLAACGDTATPVPAPTSAATTTAAAATTTTAAAATTTSAASGSGGGINLSAFSKAKGCKQIGVLLPETASSARWEGNDHPDLVKDINADIPGATIDYYNANGDATQQQTQAETALNKGDCILIVAPNDSTAAATIVTKAKAAGVPVIAYDRLIQSSDLAVYVSFDNTRVGVLQGTYVANNYKKYGTNLVMINGSQTDNNALLFNKGALSVLQPLIDAKTLTLEGSTFTPNWDNPTAQTEMEGFLNKNNNNINVAYVANDGMANTVIAALKAANLTGKVLVTGQDATTDGIHNILLGTQSMTVYKPINLEAQAAADLAKAFSGGTDTSSLTNGATTATSTGANIPSVLETPISVDISNIKDTVIKDGFVKQSDVCTGVPAGAGGVC